MPETQVITYLLDLLRARIAKARPDADRGDVAEKIVIVGVFVITLAIGALFVYERPLALVVTWAICVRGVGVP